MSPTFTRADVSLTPYLILASVLLVLIEGLASSDRLCSTTPVSIDRNSDDQNLGWSASPNFEMLYYSNNRPPSNTVSGSWSETVQIIDLMVTDPRSRVKFRAEDENGEKYNVTSVVGFDDDARDPQYAYFNGSVFVNMDGDVTMRNRSTTLNNYGYVNGAVPLFGGPEVMLTVLEGSKSLLFSDKENHCLRIANVAGTTTDFAGTCTVAGDREGSRPEESRFYMPFATFANTTHVVFADRTGIWAVSYTGIIALATKQVASIFEFRDLDLRWIYPLPRGNVFIVADMCTVYAYFGDEDVLKVIERYPNCDVKLLFGVGNGDSNTPADALFRVITSHYEPDIDTFINMHVWTDNCTDSTSLAPPPSTTTAAPTTEVPESTAGATLPPTPTRPTALPTQDRPTPPICPDGSIKPMGQPCPTTPTLVPGTPIPPATTPTPDTPSPDDGRANEPSTDDAPSPASSSSNTIVVAAVVVVAVVIIVVVFVVLYLRFLKHKHAADDDESIRNRRFDAYRTSSTLPDTELGSVPPAPGQSYSKTADSTKHPRAVLNGSSHRDMSNSGNNLTPRLDPLTPKFETSNSGKFSLSGDAARESSGTYPDPTSSSPNSITKSVPSESVLEAQRRLIREGGFTKLRLIGRGAFGSVFRVVLDDGQVVAMKELNLPEDAAATGLITDMEYEVSLVTQLAHPQVIAYLGYQYVPKEHKILLFMEFASGGSLATVCRQANRRMSESIARKYLRQVLEGLAYIHSRGVVHRDLKCDNIFLTQDGQCKLGDFGTSRVMQNTTKGGTAMANTMIGTPLFMAPEMLKEGMEDTEIVGYTKKADIWSFGILCLEFMNRGNAPWPTFSNQGAALIHVASDKGKPLVPKDITPEFRDFIGRCCERDPTKRATAAELLQHQWFQMESKTTSSYELE